MSRKIEPGDPAPGFRLTAAGSGRRVSLDDCVNRTLVLIFFSEATAGEAHAINRAVRELHPSPKEVLVASVVDLSLVPPPFWAGAAYALEGAYRKVARELPSEVDPADYVLIMADYSGLATRRYGVGDTSQYAAVVVVDGGGVVKGRHQGENLAEATLEMLE